MNSSTTRKQTVLQNRENRSDNAFGGDLRGFPGGLGNTRTGAGPSLVDDQPHLTEDLRATRQHAGAGYECIDHTQSSQNGTLLPQPQQHAQSGPQMPHAKRTPARRPR